MAEEKKQESSSLTTALPLTVVLAILAGLVITHSLPYQDERPSARPLHALYDDAQDVDARLWQDPFAAVENASEDTPAEKVLIVAGQNGKTLRMDAVRQDANSLSHTPDQIYKGKKLAPDDRVTVLAITLRGGPYQEAAEERMRRRYAVLSALANKGAVPQDERHIGYFHLDPDTGLQKRVAFEWWSDDKRKILLLWVDESSLLEHPAAKLRELLFQATKKQKLNKSFNYLVIGPNTSTVLRDMLQEVKGDKKRAPIAGCIGKSGGNTVKSALGKVNGAEIVYYSAGATASDEMLLRCIKQTTDCETVSGYLRDRGVTLNRTTAGDDAMMAVLLDELDIRKVKKTDHVVILSEWDTFYGQVMPEVFKNEWRKHYKIQGEKVEIMHPFGYMRGLDGKLPEQGDKTGSAAEKKSDSKDKSGADALIEFPEGQNQKDYLRRLADSILELDQELKDKGNQQGVAAIGILGSDVHDELMILEALRPYFPHKLFFSTDLDAAYSHPAKWPQTHNLLVASAFDLKLRQELQGKIPPFRDSYQTAFFLAAQIALEKDSSGRMYLVDLNNMPPPRLFEIGRSHPVPLPSSMDNVLPRPGNDRNALKCTWTDWSGCIDEPIEILLPARIESGRSSPVNNNTVHPLIFATSHINWTLGGMMAIVTAPVFFAFVSWWVRERMRQFAIGAVAALLLSICLTWIYAIPVPRRYLILGVGGIVALLLYFVRRWVLERVVQFKLSFYLGIVVGILLFLIYRQTQIWNDYITQSNAEPFHWLEGVSAWPSQLLRLSAALFAVAFFFWGHTRIQKMKNDLQVQGEAKTQWAFALPNEAAQLGHCDVLFVGSWKSETNNARVVVPAVLWKKYLGYCRQKKLYFVPGSILRVVVHGVAFLIMAWLLIRLTGLPNAPVRGDYAGEVHGHIILLAVPLTILLIMWVVENARLCERLIFHLSAKPSLWHKKARDWAIREKK